MAEHKLIKVPNTNSMNCQYKFHKLQTQILWIVKHKFMKYQIQTKWIAQSKIYKWQILEISKYKFSNMSNTNYIYIVKLSNCSRLIEITKLAKRRNFLLVPFYLCLSLLNCKTLVFMVECRLCSFRRKQYVFSRYNTLAFN